MFYKYNQVSSRVQSAEATVGQGVGRAAAAEVTYIPAYKATSGTNIGVMNVANRVKGLQQEFKVLDYGIVTCPAVCSGERGSGKCTARPDLPVFLKGPRDLPVYRTVMALSVVGIGLTLFSLYRMATGKLKKGG